VKGARTVIKQAALEGLRQTLDTFVPRVQQVLRQTRARVFGGDTHVTDKLLSVFEPSTEVIRKGKAGKPTEFGKMVKLQEAEHQIITAYVVYDTRPSESDLLLPALAAHTRTRPSTRPPMKRPPTRSASRGSAFRTPTPRVPRGSATRRSAGSRTARSGARGVRGGSVSSNGGTA
jgi:hypothetical protein